MIDLTEEFKANGIDWTKTNTKRKGLELDAQFSHEAREVKDGLYISIYRNTDQKARIRDNNKRDPNANKTVVYPGGVSVKTGKFEAPSKICDDFPSGIINRKKNYYDHLHREEAGVDRKVFSESLVLLWVFDLSRFSVSIFEEKMASTSRLLEAYWNNAIESWFSQNGYLLANQNMRSEWRYLNDVPLDHDGLRRFLNNLSNNILLITQLMPMI